MHQLDGMHEADARLGSYEVSTVHVKHCYNENKVTKLASRFVMVLLMQPPRKNWRKSQSLPGAAFAFILADNDGESRVIRDGS